MYGIGRSSYADFGIETEELSSMTLIAKDVADVAGNIQYIDSNGDWYWSGLWYEGGVKTTFEKIDSDMKAIASNTLAWVGLTTDNKLKFYYNQGNSMSNLNEETVKEFEMVDNVRYPLIGHYCTGYITTDGDVYMKKRKEATERILSGVTKHEPVCDFGKIYLLTDEGGFYSYELEGNNTDNDIVLFEIDSDVVSFSPEAYIKNNGEVYTFDEDKTNLLSSEMFPGADMSNVQEVLYYTSWNSVIYTTKDNKIVHAYYNDVNQCEIKEYDCTLGGVQELFNDYNAK